MDGVGEKLIFPIIHTHSVEGGEGGGGRDGSFGLYQSSNLCLDRSLPPFWFVGEADRKCVGEEGIVDQVLE
jgi:hypothetical protein